MAELNVCATSPVPDWVADTGADMGVRFSLLQGLSPESVARQLTTHQPDGYLQNWPDIGPRLTGELADCAGGLRIATYCGQSQETAFYAEYMDVGALRRRGVVVTTTPGAEFAVAECAMAYLFAFDLRIVPANTARKAGRPMETPARRRGLVGSTLGIVGMGRIGQRVAELAVGCGMDVRYHSRTRKPHLEQSLPAVYCPLPELFATSDHVSIHLPVGPGEGLLDEDVMSQADGITLINTTSVAALIDPETLLMALEEGWVSRVAVEGEYPEPYDRRLRSYGDDRVLLMPPYRSYDTAHGEHLGWERYLESLAALVDGREIPYQLRPTV